MKLVMQELSKSQVLRTADYSDDPMVVSISKTARKLCPEAAASYVKDLSPHIRVSDMWRSAAGGLATIIKKGGRSPGYSGHNYGRSIDIGVSEAMETLGFRRKHQLDDWMRCRNWHCWRLDSRNDRECWHYDFDRPPPAPGDDSGDDALQRQLVKLHGAQFKLKQRGEIAEGQDEVQIALKKLGYYHGAIDNDHGPLTREALFAFQRHWMPFFEPTGKAGPPTQRVLAFCSAEYEVRPA